jgi:hypothetical protein
MFINKKKIIVLLSAYLFVCNNILFGQSREWIEYLELRNTADSLYRLKKYDEAKVFFDRMLLSKKKFCYEYDLYRYVYCLAYTRDTVVIEPYLLEFVQAKWFEYRYINNLYGLLCTQPYWSKIDSIAKINENNKNYSMMVSLTMMAAKDQDVRTIDTLSYLMFSVDSINVAKLKELIVLYGFPTWELVGLEGARNAWLIAQHAPHEFRKWYFEYYKRAVEENNADIKYCAYLIDRIRLWEKMPQLYGTQGSRDHLQPVEDVERLNDRRETVLLSPLDISKIKISDVFPIINERE